MAATLHFISGKGGTGKSTFAASLAHCLAKEPRNLPLLVLDLQGSGSSAKMLGIDEPTYQMRPSLWLNDVWAARIFPQESFQEYFARSLYPGSETSALAQATSVLRERLVKGIFSNSIVRSFIEVCPGLEPAAMLGKIHFECTEGTVPETNQNWKTVIVDAPSTGHFLSLFSSIEALTRVFSAGIILKQAREIFNFVSRSQNTQIHLLSLPSDLPIQESLELRSELLARGVQTSSLVVNRVREEIRVPADAEQGISSAWKNFLKIEQDLYGEERTLISKMRQQNLQPTKIFEIPEVYSENPRKTVEIISGQLGAFL